MRYRQSIKTHHQKVDFNIFDGMTVKGCASHTISNGKLVYANRELNVEKGAGNYVRRPPYTPFYDAVEKQSQANVPTPVKRSN